MFHSRLILQLSSSFRKKKKHKTFLFFKAQTILYLIHALLDHLRVCGFTNPKLLHERERLR